MKHFYSKVDIRGGVSSSHRHLNAQLWFRSITFLILFLGITSSTLWGQTYTFTNCGQTGNTGPTQAQVNSAYSSTNLNGKVSINTQGIQEWSIPFSATYRIEVLGAGGGGTSPGYGARMIGEFSLIKDNILKIVVGQKGIEETYERTYKAGGGGGGSFVVSALNTPLIVAGGGGGCSADQSGHAAITAISGANTGSAGNGGSSNQGGSGAGFSGNGGSGTHAGGTIAYSFINNAYGGVGSSDGGTGYGGFGGGGGDGYADGGGGGGYSGGNEPSEPSGAYGGGSYNIGVNQINSSDANSGHGQVLITMLCSPISITASPATNVCPGTEVTLTATSTNGGTITWDNGISNGVAFTPASTTTYTATSTNADDCSTTITITVEDNEDPVTPTLTDVTGECSATAVAPTTTDACAGTITGTTANELTYTTQGTHVITWNFDDGNGNDIDVTQNVIITDVTNPTAVAHDTTLYLDTDGLANLTPASVDDGSIDNCGIDTYVLDITDFTGEDIGENTVTLTITDVAGNSDFSTLTVTVLDTIDPVVTCPAPITVNTDPGVCGAVVDYIVSASDNCTSGFELSNVLMNFNNNYANITANIPNPYEFNMDGLEGGVNSTNILDGGSDLYDIGNNITTNLSGGDILYSDNTLIPLADFGATGQFFTRKVPNMWIMAADLDNVSSFNINGNLGADGGGIADGYASTISYRGDTYTIFVKRVHGSNDPSVNHLIIIPHNAAANHTFATSTDNDQHQITGLTGTTRIYYLLFFGGTSATSLFIDNLTMETIATRFISEVGSISTVQTTGLPSGSEFPVGITTNTFVATDESGNTTTDSFIVTVVDNIAPTVNTQNITVQLDSDGLVTITPAQINNVSTDNCGIASYALDIEDFSCADVGTPVQVTLTVTDIHGNSNTNTAMVTVEDNVAPTANCQNISVPIDATIVADDINNGSSDNCGIATLSIDKSNFSLADFGANTVTLTVTDNSGNSTNCVSTVTVEDIVSPEIICNSIDVILNNEGNYYLSELDIEALSAGTTDNVDSYSDLWIQARPISFSCEDVGEVKVDVVAEDKMGNRSYCRTIVNVIDTASPKFETVTDVFVETNPGVCETQITYPEIVSISACSEVEFVNGIGPDGIFPVGITTETWKATNTSGDSAMYSFNVVVTSANASPAIDSIANVAADENSPLVNVPLTGISFGADCIEQDVTISALSQNSDLISAIEVNYTSPDSIGSLDITLVEDVFGSDTITVTVSDSEGAEESLAFTLKVNPIKRGPAIDAIADLYVHEDSLGIAIDLSGISFGNNTKAETLRITAQGENLALLDTIIVNYTSPESTASIDLTLEENAFGTDTIFVTVIDDLGGTISEIFVLHVDSVNDSPYLLEALPDVKVNASYPYSLSLIDMLGLVFDDIDDDELAFDAQVEGTEGLPEWTAIESGVLTAIPMIADTGSYSFVVTATDTTGATATDTFLLAVEGYPTTIGAFDEGVFEVKMYPNPSRGEVNLQINSSEIGNVEVVVRSITGSEVFRKEYRTTEQIRIDIKDQVSGVFLISLQQGNNTVIKKLILDRK